MLEYEDSDEGLASDPDSLDDDVLRSVDAFSSDEDEDRHGIFHLDTTKQENLLENRSIRDRARSVASIMKLTDGNETVIS